MPGKVTSEATSTGHRATSQPGFLGGQAHVATVWSSQAEASSGAGTASLHMSTFHTQSQQQVCSGVLAMSWPGKTRHNREHVSEEERLNRTAAPHTQVSRAEGHSWSPRLGLVEAT